MTSQYPICPLNWVLKRTGLWYTSEQPMLRPDCTNVQSGLSMHCSFTFYSNDKTLNLSLAVHACFTWKEIRFLIVALLHRSSLLPLGAILLIKGNMRCLKLFCLEYTCNIMERQCGRFASFFNFSFQTLYFCINSGLLTNDCAKKKMTYQGS